MKFLSVTAILNGIHHDVFCSHEWQLAHETFSDDFRIYLQAICYIQAKIQNSVNCKESFCDGNSLICRVIQRSLKPLCSGCNSRIQSVNHDISGKRCDTLASHRISLIRHSRGTDLIFFKRLFYFLQVLQQANVVGHFVCGSSDACKNIHHSCIYFSGVGLTGYRIAFLEAHLSCNHRINLINGSMISVEQLQERGLCSGGTFGPKEFQTTLYIFQVLQIHHEFLHPESCSLPYCGRLCRLEMCKSECRLGLLLISEFGQSSNHIHQFLFHQFQSFCHNDNVCVITNVAGCSAKVNDAGSFRALLAKSVHMTHNVMTNFFLSGTGHIIIDVFHMLLHFINHFLGDGRLTVLGKAKLHLCLSKCDPKFSPGSEFHILGENELHFLACISL